ADGAGVLRAQLEGIEGIVNAGLERIGRSASPAAEPPPNTSYTRPVAAPADEFRMVMGRFATGISVVTTLDGEQPAGITVNALSSVSLEAALVMGALERRRLITPMVRRFGRYAVNILGADQQLLSDCFAH